MTHKNIYPVFLLLLFVSFCYIFTNHYYFLYYFIDGPFHLSAIREISRHFPPRSPVVHMEGIPDYHYNISIVFQAILLKITGSIHLTVLISGAIFSAATIGSFALFARKYV
ncbi:MAG: hypothetical protein KAI75_05840, partial [Desulfobulbaceae bacterium]|nr:hypothetical protein [Desulfobulbaceae bacterium]